MGDSEAGDGDDHLVVFTRGSTRLASADVAIPLRPRERAVVAAIATRSPSPVDVDTAVRLVWGAQPPASARKSLHNHVARIRSQAPGLIDTVDQGYVLVGARVDHTTGGLDELPLGDLAGSEDVDELRRVLDERIHAQLERDVREALRHPTDDSLRAAQHLVELRPDRERLWYLLAATQAGLGRRREALQSVGAARRTLSEVGLEPGRELQQLESDLLEFGATPISEQSATTSPRLHAHRDDPFVGRTSELAQLAAAWAHAQHVGAPQLVIVRGEAGIGKTRLVDEFVRRLDPHAPPVVNSRVRRDDDRPLGAVHEIVGAVDTPLPTDRSSDDEIVDALQRRLDHALGRLASRPTIWCLDDLHWMPTDTLQPLGRALEATNGPLLVIATHRIGEFDDGGHLDRSAPTTVIELEPMNRSELEELVAAWHVLPDQSTSLDLFHERTAGLPLFVNEVTRAASRRGEQLEALDVPGVVRDWVRTRLSDLDDDADALMRTAALIGIEFDLDVASEAAAIEPDRADDIVDDLVARGVLGVAARPGSFEFSHGITHEIAAEMTGPARARRAHLAVARVLAAQPAPEPSPAWHASLAHHLHLGGGDPADVRSHALAACDEQIRRGAWSAADAAVTIALATDPDDATRAELLARRGRARLRLQRFVEAAAALHEAISLARSERLPDVWSRAALDLVGRGGRGAAIEATDAERVDIVRDALAGLGPDDGDDAPTAERRSELERELAFALILGGDLDERRRLLDDSLLRLERLDDVPVRAHANALLARRYARPEPESIDQRIADIDRVLAMDHGALGPETVAAAHVYRIDESIRSGRPDEALQSLGEIDHALARRSEPYWTWAAAGWRVILAIHEGDLDAAEALALEAWSIGGQSAAATAGFGVNLTNIRLLQGRSGEMIDLLSQAVASNPAIPAYRAVLTLCASEHGDFDLATEHFEWFERSRFDELPHDPNRPLALAVLAHAAADLGATDGAATLLPLLLPHAGQHIAISTYGSGGAYWGTATHALARLATTANDTAAAAAWFADARANSTAAPLFAARVERHAAGISAAGG